MGKLLFYFYSKNMLILLLTLSNINVYFINTTYVYPYMHIIYAVIYAVRYTLDENNYFKYKFKYFNTSVNFYAKYLL